MRPGRVTSKNDRDRHYIGAAELMRLYGVTPGECWIVDEHDPIPRSFDARTLIELRPRFDGNYALPENSQGEQP